MSTQYHSYSSGTMKLQTFFVLLFLAASVDHGSAWSWQAHAPKFLHSSEIPKIINTETESLARVNTDEAAKLGYLIVSKLQELIAAASHKDVFANVKDPVCVSHLGHIFYQLDLWINKGILPDTFVLQCKPFLRVNVRCKRNIKTIFHFVV